MVRNGQFRLVVYSMLIILALTGLIFMFGPRPQSDLTIRFKPPEGAADLDAYLASEEAGVQDIRPGLGKEIVWAHPDRKERTPLSIVYLHGFSASKGETRPLPDEIAKALGANLYFARLTGHGVSSEAMGKATAANWLDDVAEALWIGNRIGERTIVISTSTGGTLITPFLADPSRAAGIAAVVYISPNFGLKAVGSSLLTAPFARQIVHLVLGANRENIPANAAVARYWTNRYPVEALLPMASLVKSVRALPFPSIRTPALFYYASDDQVVDAAITDRVLAAWGGPKTRIEPGPVEDPGRHVIAGDALSPSGTGPAVAAITGWLARTLQH